MEKLEMESMDITERNVEKILEIFPEVSTEEKDENGNIKRKIDFEHLKEVLGSSLSDEKQRYSFTWPGKREADAEVGKKIRKTLRPDRETSVDWDKTKNIYIEGDNLEALKLLQKGYMGKIKMIYIDPPYNTGNDFIYKDNFAESKESYDEKTGVKDNEGNRLVLNNESNGRFHSDWCSMIYPRLKLARDLLSDDGVIFISIDDNEQANLRKICDEVFGEDNFICNFVRKNKAGSGHDSSKIAIEFDYVLCYAKNYFEDNINKEIIDVENDAKYKLIDEYCDTRGKYYLRDLDYKGSYSEKMDYPITTPDGSIIYPGGMFGKPNTWRWSKEKFEWGLKNEYIVFKEIDSCWKVYIKQYQFVDNDGNPYERKLPYRALIDYSNAQGSTQFNEIMETNAFSFPKPIDLLINFLNIATDKDSIILDFFSGSATTAHAVMQLNAEDGGNRRFILVQLPEKCDPKSEAFKADYKTICDIGKERIRRAGNKIKKENEGKDIDIGFRVFKIDESNMKESYYMPEEYTKDKLKGLENNIKEDRTDEDLLFGVMLDWEMDVSLPYETQTICGQKVYFVNDNELVACFGDNLEEEVFKQIAEKKPKKVVFKDSSFKDDSSKMNTEGIFKRISPDTDKIRII